MKTKDKKNELLDIARKVGTISDRWNNIVWVERHEDGFFKKYRYKFNKQVIRLEVKYPNDMRWIRLRSYRISKIQIDTWTKTMESIKEKQQTLKSS